MKKIYLTTLLLSATLFIGKKDASAYPTGINFLTNYSGIAGVTCNTSNCHTGGLNSGPGSVVITTDIPAAGYIGGETYQITVTVNSGGSNGVRYGFACSAGLEGATTSIGGFAAADNTTLIRNNGLYIVHNTAVNGNGNTSHAFVFNWTAPAGGSGTIKFFAAGNSANGNNATSGDEIYNSNITVEEMPGFGLTESVLHAFNLFPNPATELVSVKVPDYMLNSEIRMIDMMGKTVFNQQLTESTVNIDINAFTAGIYVMEIVKDGKSYTSKLMKN